MANEKFVMMAENPSGTGSFSMNRKSGSTVGLKSHAEGDNTVASGLYSHSEGSGSAALGYMAHAEGNKTVASGSYAHAEGGSYELPDVTANSTAAEARAAWQAKRSTIAHGQFSHAEGSNTLALGNWAHTEGAQTIGSGSTSHAEGNNTEASGDSAHSEGMNTIASNYASHSSGKYNAAMTTGGTISNTVGTAFVVGNGTSSTVRSNALSVQYNGVVKAKSTITGSTTADYAEFFEWGDGNLNEEDRVGKFVTLVGDKIRIATNTDDYILGVVSGEPFVLGNGDCDTWNGMFLRDEYRRTIYEPAPKVVEILDEEGNPTGEYEEVAGQYEGIRPKLNPDYDPEQVYVSRFNRPEWAPIAMLGVVAVVHDGTAVVDGYVTVNASGIATASDKSAINSYRVIKSNSDSVVEILFTASKNHGHSYLPLAGGTVTGRVRFSDEETMYIDALGIKGNSNQTISGMYEIEAELFKGELRGNAESASTLSETLGVAQGGTGETTLAAGQALIGNGTSKVTTRAITNLTSRSGISVNTNLITGSTLAYWNGAYNTSGNSNITYCYKGALGDAAVKGVDTTPTSGSANLITSGAMYTALAGKATSSHTHNYAGSSSAGGVATSAAKLSNTTAIGSATQPVYFNANGVPVACTYTLGKSVPSNAVFTDTHWTTGLVVGASATATANAAATNGNVHLNAMDNTVVRNAHKITGSGATTVTSDANGNITISSTNTDTDTKVTQTNTTGNANYRLLLSANANDTTETNTALKSSKFIANPYTGAFTATKVYNAVWNDYAEWFEKEDLEEVFEPGDIVTWSEKGVTKTSDSNDSLVVGVYSDTYGHIVGGDELEDMEDNRKKFVSVGLTGRVNVKVTGRVFRGDLIVSSDIPGVGTVNNNPIPGTVIGKALEDKEVEDVSKIKMLIMLG